ncbi:MAG: 4'-phosphopantetheinyl transferase superfamily protein [Verrucomicrobiales bacterium]|nr:4'-phosphopantetheinyl transferase superfamily protein [Verrucomicrobiales bacterium]
MHQQIPNGIIEGEVVVLAFEVDPIKESWTDYTDTLPKNEIDRAREFHYPQDKLRFTKCRSILRNTLSKWSKKAPKKISIAYGENKKPHLKENPEIQFNISHTEGFAGIAFCKEYEVGIDVENTTRATDIDQVAEKVFTKREQRNISVKNDLTKKKIFFRHWTAKEAFLKNTGLGLTLDPKKIESNLPTENKKNGTFECAQVKNSSSLRFVGIPCPEPYIMTLCASEESLGKISVFPL